MKKKLIIIGLILALFTGIVYAALIDEQKFEIVDKSRELADAMDLQRDRARQIVQKWNSLGLGSGGANEMTQADLDAMTGYSGLTVAEYTAVITTFQAFETWIDAGNDDNLQKIRR